MNRFDLNAIGWVVVRDASLDTIRAAVGCKPRIDRAALPELSRRWVALAALCAGHGASLDATHSRVLAATSAFVSLLMAASPAMYSRDALCRRCVRTLLQAFIGFMGCALVAQAEPPLPELWNDAGLILFLMGLWSLTTGLQLRRMAHVVDAIASAMHVVDKPASNNLLDRNSP